MNARVYRVEEADGEAFVEKDFSGCPWIVRQTLGRFLVWRECWILRRLGATGLVPGGVRRLSPFALREAFVAGFALRDSDTGVYASNVFDPSKVFGVPAEMLREPVPAAFFDALEEGVRAVHAAGFVHLDLHNSRNVMVSPGWRPVLIDWQSALPTRWMPGPLRRALERIDLAGIYKFRDKFRPGDLSPEQKRFLHRRRMIRRFLWVPRIHFVPKGGAPAPRAPAVEAGVSLGSNLGDRAENLLRAVRMLAETPGVRLLARSSLYETEPVDVPPPHGATAATRSRRRSAASAPATTIPARSTSTCSGSATPSATSRTCIFRIPRSPRAASCASPSPNSGRTFASPGCPAPSPTFSPPCRRAPASDGSKRRRPPHERSLLSPLVRPSRRRSGACRVPGGAGCARRGRRAPARRARPCSSKAP